MGNLNLKGKFKGTNANNNIDEKKDQDPAPTKTEEPGPEKVATPTPDFDLPKKRKLAEYLLSNDLNIFKKHLQEVRNLNDEKFSELFDGNTEYFYNVADEKGFRQLAQKFEDNNDLIYEAYDKENCFKYALQIWRPNILQGLKEAEGEEKKMEILKKYKIDVTVWDPAFREAFNIMMSAAPFKTMAERMQNYIQADYGNFDELIKNVDKCKKNIGKDKGSHCNKTLSANLDTSMTKIIDTFVPNFISQLATGLDSMPDVIKKAEERDAIKQILKTPMTKSRKKKLIENVKKIYKERNKDTTFLGVNEEYKKLKELSTSFNKEDDKYAFTQGKIYFKKMGIKDKAGAVFGNKLIKHAVLGLSMANLTYSVMHLSKTFMNHKAFQEQFQFKLSEINQRFIKHQNEVKVITDETDIDKAVELTIECGKKFQQDLDDVEELISDITDAMNGVKTEKNKTIINMIGSGGAFFIGLFGTAVTKGEDRLEYATASFADVFAFAVNVADLNEQKKIIMKYQETMKAALNLKNEIITEINKLRQKFYDLTHQHHS